ncbi:MAG: glycosyltransferase family 39 protein [Candidatus Omnitrophica bacterium]|nr:glycosyltransferase family 39 protein [Candidatus Omnitrophota bacterium]MBU4333771.1 glycosyltransferase family 39 protein [Candidatus Omnitrophota bacterium]
MIIIFYFIAFLLGYLTISLLVSDKIKLQTTLRACLSLGLGLGLCALLTFLSFLIFNKYSPVIIILLYLAAIAFLLFININKLKKNIKDIFPGHSALKNIRSKDILAFTLWGTLIVCIFLVAKRLPFGRWDAWALYNMKTKFLLFSGSWKDIFRLHWHTQPGYPLLLPFINASAYSFAQKTINSVCFSTAILLSFSCGLLLFGSLKQFTRSSIAFIGSTLLLTNPVYLSLSTAQYADILLAFYLLASITTIIITLQTKDKGFAVLSGLFLGLMTFTKNEGIVFCLILFGLTCLNIIIFNKDAFRSRFKIPAYLLIGLAATAIFTIVFKLFLAPPNPDIFPANVSNASMEFLNFKGLMIVVNFTLKEIVYKGWCFIWPLMIIMFAGNPMKFFRKESSLISVFFICYLLILLFIYLTTINFDLTWRLTSTLQRILFYLLPSALFLGFFAHWRRNDTEQE